MTAAIHGFFNPVCAVALVTETDRIPLFGNLTPKQADSAGGVHSLNHVESVSVELTLGLLPKIQLTLAPPYEECTHILNSTLLELGDKYLEVQFGYLSRVDGSPVLTAVYRGRLELPDVQLGEDPSITLVAAGDVSGMARTESRGVFNRKTRREILETVARGKNPSSPRKLTVSFTVVDTFPNAASHTLLNQPVSMVQGTATDLEFIRRVAADCACKVAFDGENIILVPLSLRTERTPKHILRLYHISDGKLSPGEYPLLSVTSPTKALYTGGALQLVLRGVDSKTRKIEEVVVSDKSHPIPRTSATSAGDVSPSTPAAAGKPAPGKAPGSVMMHGGTQPKDQQRAANLTAASAEDMAINLEVDTFGIPDIQPADIVSVRGLGVRYDRNYEVESLTHSWEDGEYRTHLKLLGNTYDMLLKKAQVAPKGPTNTQKPDTAAGGGSVKQPKSVLWT